MHTRSAEMTVMRSALAAGIAAMLALPAFGQNALDPKPRTQPGGPLRPEQQGPLRNPLQNPSSRSTPQSPRSPRSRAPGSALDASLQLGSGGLNLASMPVDFNARNLIVTHNVAGGRGFRGTVGYLAPTDFRGTTAGDSTQSFRSNSAVSSPQFIAAGGYQERFSLAQGLGVFEYRRDATPPMANPIAAAAEGRIRLDQTGSNLAFARQQDQAIEPVLFAVGVDSARRNVEFAASGLLGLRSRRPDDAIAQSKLPLFERARVRREVNEGRLSEDQIFQPFDTRLNADADARIDARLPDGKIDPVDLTPSGRASAYDDIVRRVVERYGERPDVRIDADPRALERARKDIGKLNSAFGTRVEPEEEKESPLGIGPLDPTKPAGDPPAGPQPLAPKHLPDDTVPAPANDDSGGMKVPIPESPEAQAARDRARLTESVREAAQALNHDVTVSDLSPGDRARVDELVRDAQQSLARGDFFKAERHFNQALYLSPDNPLLVAGLAHAQLGAGLYLSSALAIRTLFAQHPEMIDVRYDPKLVPNETRLRLAIDTLRPRLDGKDGDSYGLMMAYIGNQLDDEAVVSEGLAALTGTMENDLLREFLMQVWLDDADASTDPSQQSPAADPAQGPDAAPGNGARPN